MKIKIADEGDDQKPRLDQSTEEIPADEEWEGFGEDMKLARRIVRENRRALRALADAPPASERAAKSQLVTATSTGPAAALPAKANRHSRDK